MLAEPIYRNGYVLPPFTHFYPRAGGKKEGSYSVVNDKNQKVAKLIFSNNKLNGVCLFYDSNGMVKEKFTYVNDAIDGWGYIYDNGVKVNCYLYKMGVLEMALNQEPGMDGYFRQIDVPNNIVNGIYKFDDTCVKYGIGYEFKNNSIAAVKQYKNGKEVMKLKEMNNGIMVEYDSNGTKVYEGTFKDSLNEGFPRNGHGKEFNRDELLYEGNWENGKKSGRGNSYLRGSLVYSGTWQNNLPNDEGTLMDDGDVKYQGRWVDGKFRVGEYDYYDYSTNSVVQNASATPGYSPSQTPQGKYQAPYGVSIPLSPLSTADPGILPSGGLDLNNIPQTIPMSAITTPAMQTPYVGGYPAMAPQAVVAPGPSYIMPVYPQESIPSSAVVAKPVVVQAEPISYITGQVKPLEKAGSSKKKRIALIISLILLIILLIAGVIVFIWYRTTPTITVRNYEDLKNLDWRVGELIIPANSYNEYSDISFTLSGFERLTKITIKDASCRDVKFFSLEDLPALKTIIVGRESFNNQNNWKDGISYDSSRSVSIVNCPSLTTITFGVGSFVAFSSLKLKGCLTMFQ